MALACFVHSQRASVDVRSVHGFDRSLSFVVATHFDEAEASRTTGFTVGHDEDVGHRTTAFLEGGAERVRGGVVVQVSNVEAFAHVSRVCSQ